MPDLNTVPPSPHVLASATATATAPRRPSSQQMPPPPVPTSPSLNILPSNQSAVNQATASSSALPSPQFLPPSFLPMGDNTGVGPGPGPARLPRPLTAADLHSQLEKEQEAVVNRLTRELSLLRAAQNASVVSNTSSTSASGPESAQLGGDVPLTSTGPGLSHHRVGIHHRTSSNTSARSFTANVGSVSTTSIAGISSPAPLRPSQPPALGGISLSRQNSSASRRSRAGSPSPASHASYSGHASQSQTPHQSHSYTQSHLNEPGMTAYFANRLPLPSGGTTSSTALTPASELSPGILPATSRYEETAFYRAELDSVKRENEALKRRVRELERQVRERRSSDASRASQSGGNVGRPRSDSVSTTASASVAASTAAAGGVSIAAQRDGRERPRVVSMLSAAGSVGVGVPEDEVRVGESAASAGLGDRAQHEG
ncbi:hypothetical protein B0T22DRAFT_484467 [Podospora appendiculata]|uniref:Uncharacterized protein n=1 Tax=Podospora appendiculata TaxID=314037 RepID=A0AAE0X0W7_9PEZI|nr:hypothetical protein B0T22DRAFT_484467 [Podospora appendiculata]